MLLRLAPLWNTMSQVSCRELTQTRRASNAPRHFGANEVEGPFTRAGAFRTNSQGHIVTPDGFALEPAITIPADAQNVTIAPDGTITVKQPSQKDAVEVGRLQLVSFINPAGLESIGRNLMPKLLFNQLARTVRDASAQFSVRKQIQNCCSDGIRAIGSD